MSEFTGERVIPGEVNDDLWAEHIARYAFAARLAPNARVLDIGCGTGYGTAELAQHARTATGIDISDEAIGYARTRYPIPNVTFLTASATALPFAPESFDLITAFEVIEHLENWHGLLIEARRLLHPNGAFLVSTPNKIYYAESRAGRGPNPFHTHEFEFDEFRDALSAVFPGVAMVLQNRLESQAFYPHVAFGTVEAQIDSTRGSPNEANFFLGLCTVDRRLEPRSLIYIPQAANLLRERERHIRLLENELEQNKIWLAEVRSERQKGIEALEQLQAHLEEQNRWTLHLNQDYKAALERIAELQDLLQSEQTKAIEMAAAYQHTVDSLEEENRRKTQWAIDTEKRLSATLAQKCDELAETVRLLDQAEATVVERTTWAQDLDRTLQQANAKLNTLAKSPWVKIGRAAGVAPKLGGDG